MSNYAKRRDKNRIVLRKGEAERPNGTYCYRWTDIDGKRRSVYAKTLAQLRDKEQHCQELPPKQITIAEQYAQWIKSRRDFKPATLNLYNKAYEIYIKDALGEKNMVDLKRSDIKQFIINISNNEDISTSRIKCIHSILSQLFDMAVDDEIVDINPCDKIMDSLIKRFKPRGKRNALTAEEENELLEFTRSSRDFSRWYSLFAVLADTGMRIGQALSLTWKDVNLEKGFIDINKNVVYINKKHIVQTPKTKDSNRRIPLSQRAFDILSEMKRESCVQLVFPNRYGQYLIATNINKILVHIVDEYNASHEDLQLPHVSCHIFRHTCATKMNACGVNIKCAQRILGHSNIQTTMNVYTDISQEMIMSEIKKLTP